MNKYWLYILSLISIVIIMSACTPTVSGENTNSLPLPITPKKCAPDNLRVEFENPELEKLIRGESGNTIDCARINNLTHLKIDNTNQLSKGLEKLQSLSSLTIEGISLSNVEYLKLLPSLQKLSLKKIRNLDADNLSDLFSLSKLNLNQTDFPLRNQLPQIHELSIDGQGIGENLQKLLLLPNLTILTLRGEINNIEPLASLPKLERLKLFPTGSSPLSLLPLANHKSLKSLSIFNSYSDFDVVSTIPTLSEIEISSPSAREIEILSELGGLKRLTISWLAEDYDYKMLTKLNNLMSLSISGEIKETDWLIELNQLEELSFDNGIFNDLTFLKSMPNLRHISLNFNKISDISVFSSDDSFTKLKTLFIYGNCLDLTEGSKDIEVIQGLRNKGIEVYDWSQNVCDK